MRMVICRCIVYKFPSVADIMTIPLEKYITLDPKNCGYRGMTEELIVNYDHPFF